MYKTHVPRIKEMYSEHPVEVLRGLILFAVASIQQQFQTVPAILRDWQREGTDAKTMWGMKKKAYEYIQEDSGVRRLSALVTYAQQTGDVQDVIDTLLEVPSLNVVKAGFVAQCLGFQVGCIDTVNANLYQVDPEAFYVSKSNATTVRRAKIQSYLTLCSHLGGAEFLWDAWCTAVSQKYEVYNNHAENVSQQHVDCIVLASEIPS